ncbi:MAG: L-lactate dehydrogenase [Lactobacillus sp.]|jgi:L-lactate dehydrogenase|nr:L-lactate dehydrogenase [Lactobacillus sp.]
MRSVGIIGLGHVGMTTAFNLVAQNVCDKLILIESNQVRADAEYLDLVDGQSAVTPTCQIIMNDYASLKKADVVIFAAGQGDSTDDGDRNSEMKTTKKAVDEVAPLLIASGFKGVLVNISNPCDVITAYWQAILPLPQNQVIGTGTMLDTNRMRRGLAQALGCNAADVQGFNMGEHGESQFTAWSTVALLNQDQAALETLDRVDLENKARAGGWTIYEGKHYTNYGIAMVALVLTRAILSDSGATFSLSYFDPAVGTYIGHPAKVGHQGIMAPVPVALTPTERAKYQASADYIQTNFEKLKLL